jgi:hypothetical protein
MSSDAITDDLRREITLLKSRIEGLEKELMNQEIELKAAKVSLKDKNNDPMVKNLSVLFQQFSLHLTDLQSVQKEMDKIFQLHKTTWDLQNLHTQLNIFENQKNIFSEEIYNSLHNRDENTENKDKNNNTTITKAKSSSIVDKQSQKILKDTAACMENVKEHKSVKILEKKSTAATAADLLQSGNNTLKRKRESKSPHKITDSPAIESSKKQSSQTIATILVSKTKTKSGLPLLMKK